MSGWTHAICRSCYANREPGRVPVALKDAELEKCCFCGVETKEGIYYRADPASAQCGGKHEDETL
jgi:hypothetical protein